MRRSTIGLFAGATVILAVAFVFSAPVVHAAECMTGTVSWYGNQHHGRQTASGARFNQWGRTAAMMGKKHSGETWRVFYGKKSVDVLVNDTGDFAKYGRFMDLSRGGFRVLAPEGKGVLRGVKACRVR